jgi:hypothetical protein
MKNTCQYPFARMAKSEEDEKKKNEQLRNIQFHSTKGVIELVFSFSSCWNTNIFKFIQCNTSYIVQNTKTLTCMIDV